MHRSLFWLLFALFLLALAGPLAASVADAAPNRPRVGLVLGGGGARGIAHVGVLKMLRELHVPVDCIAGTSMGSIVGGLYAAGMTPEQMTETVQRIDWPAAFTDGPPRADLPFRTKQQQRVLLTNNGVGVKDGQVQLPQGLLQGQNLLLLLQELSLPAAEIRDFDKLQVPYRAVATDLATGAPVVLKSGELAMAMRASMSIPSALVPVELDGKLLVDGGVSDNIPVDVVRKLCRPDVIIVVDVGSPLAPASELNSLLSITGQLTTILTVRNAQQQIKTLGRRDILITPDLGDLSSLAFDRSREAVAIGYAAAQDKRGELSRLSLSPDAYQAHLAARPDLPETHHPTIDFIRIKNNTRLSDQVIENQLHVKPGEPLDPQELNRNLNVIFGMGDFQQVTYSLVEEEGKTGLVVEATQRHIGANTLNFGLFLGANMKGDSLFDLSVAYTMSQLNSLGGQWRTFVQIGGNIKLETDFYQPLDAVQEYFINPYFSYQQYNLDLFDDSNEDNASFRIYRANIGLEVGRNLEHWGRLSLGLRYGPGKNDLRFGQISTNANTISEGSFDDGGYSIRWAADTLDNLNFPTSGYYGSLVFYDSLTALGASNNFSTLSLNAAKPYTWGKQTLIPRVILAGRLSGDLDAQDLFLLGGFLKLSGYQVGQISGQYAALGELIYMYRLDNASAAFTIPLYAGGSLEVGGAWNELDDITLDSLIPAGSLFLGADTPLGPLYLAGGVAKGDASLYLMLGRLF
ncbi:MAG: patatin-like phospholipase family protein [Candidatus Contendobacter sp.]|nr:patatin-like phospholipase family protein [Candidatus Contendobacter sp.]MDG4559426.1 patatin-like phospholipase family protein [Candidatus Contendobacter sp.]